jgi:hypothetical protein
VKFRELMVEPRLRLTLPEGNDGAAVALVVSWKINPADSSCWERPLCLTISPANLLGDPAGSSDDTSDHWETIVDLSREDARLLRDFLTSLLASPDLREPVEDDADGT